jgi:hypothetical protein
MQKPIPKHKLLKSQISSTKLQMVRQAHHPEPGRRVNLKLQYDLFGIWDLCFGISGLSGLGIPPVIRWIKNNHIG